MTNRIYLDGCAPDPLLHYLKALGVLRIVGEQLDPQVRGAWSNDVFFLETEQSKEEITTFFLDDYRPTPVVAPWNGGSGFYPNDKSMRKVLDAIAASTSPRLEAYRHTIEAAHAVVDGREKAPKEREKADLLRTCRRVFPDAAVAWLDAAIVLGADGPEYPPLLGTGGNDGRLEFTYTFMDRLVTALLQDGKKRRLSEQQFVAALFAEGRPELVGASVGQYHPGGIGGPNATQGISGDSFVNPWDFVLAIEGSLLLASATVRQLAAGARSRASFPFTAISSFVGHGTAAGGEDVRAEMWLPLWSRPARLAEVAHVFGEGRAAFGRRKGRVVRTGFDFARAAAGLGVDRGIDAFQRYGFMLRNGRAYLGTSLGRFEVTSRESAALVSEIDRWLDRLQRATNGDQVAPRFQRARREIEESVFALCASGSPEHLRSLLVALGAAETELARSPKFRGENSIPPLQDISGRWVSRCDDGSAEFEIAAALASISEPGKVGAFRENLEPVTVTERSVAWTSNDHSVAWGEGPLEVNLANVLHRRSVEARQRNRSHPEIDGRRPASLWAVHAFLTRETNDLEIAEYLNGLALVAWGGAVAPTHTEFPSALSRAYALLKLLFLPEGKLRRSPALAPIKIGHEPQVVPLLRAGRAADAVAIAVRRLRASGLSPVVDEIPISPADGPRLAASLLIPISWRAISRLDDLVLHQPEKTEE